MIRPLRPIKRQFFLTFMVMGSLMPYLSVYLSERGLTDTQLGDVLALSGLATMVVPVLMTLLADTRLSSRLLLGGCFAFCAAGCGAMLGAEGLGWIAAAFGLYALALAPLMPLQDGLFFRAEQRNQLLGIATPPYHRVRVWGTVGFLIPAMALFFIIRATGNTSSAVVAAVICGGLGVVNAWTLPRDRAETPTSTGGGAGAGALEKPRDRLPTLEALRSVMEPHMLVFWFAMWLLHLAITAYYGFYPLYLTRTLGIGREWIGLIANIGVVGEIFFMLGFGLLVRRLSLRGLMIVGTGCMAVRFALLAAVPTVAVGVGTQLFHGIMVVTMHVAPPIYLNRHAQERFRSSIQGLFAMVVFGTGRVVGNNIAGRIAEVSMTGLFVWASGLCVVAGMLFVFAFREATPGGSVGPEGGVNRGGAEEEGAEKEPQIL